jgi:hypothetical protein
VCIICFGDCDLLLLCSGGKLQSRGGCSCFIRTIGFSVSKNASKVLCACVTPIGDVTNVVWLLLLCCRWQASEPRHLQLLQRELLQHSTHTIDLVVAVAAAPAALAAAAQGVQLQEEVQSLVEGLVAASQQQLLWTPQ